MPFPDAIAMVSLRCESLTHHSNQMKLSNAIAAAAVIGPSFITTSPALKANVIWVSRGISAGQLLKAFTAATKTPARGGVGFTTKPANDQLARAAAG